MLLNNKLIILFFYVTCLAFGQTSNRNLVITYSVNTSDYGITNYYWIIPDSTINNTKRQYKIYPLYFEIFSNKNLNDCMKTKDINIFTDYDSTQFDNKYLKQMDKLKSLVTNKENKNLVQVINKKWQKKHRSKQKVDICITPIIGNFYTCNTGDRMEKMIKYKGKILIPKSNFKIDYDYLNTKRIKEFLFTADFSFLNYINKI